jgi:TPR repeat protein
MAIRVPQDYAEASEVVSKAAEQGDARSPIQLGCDVCQGHGVPQDDARAYMFFNMLLKRLEC